MKLNHIYNGDCLEVMKIFEDGSIDLTITSPPYDNLRDYKGYTFDFKGIAKQIYRITKQGGVVVWVVGDTTKDFCESLTSFRQALYFKEIGFNLLDTMIYYKKNYAPAYPTLKRYANQFEYMFIFSKAKPKTFNPIQKIKSENTNKRYKYGGIKFASKKGYKNGKKINNTKTTKDASNVWSYGVGSAKNKHPAVFPEKLAKDHILSWSNKGDLILDPMCGSGTTCKMARLLGRNYIGIEISKEYCKIAEERLRQQVLL